MGEKGSRRNLAIVLIIIVVVIIVAVAVYFFVSGNNAAFSFMNPDFSAGAGAMDKATAAGNSNAFENTKLNPFENVP